MDKILMVTAPILLPIFILLGLLAVAVVLLVNPKEERFLA